VSDVSRQLGDDVHHDALQGDRVAILRPPRHSAERIERQLLDGRVGEGPHSPVEVDDAVTGFVLGRVPVGLRVGLEILVRDPLVGRRPFTAEGVGEVPRSSQGPSPFCEAVDMLVSRDPE
jgi:hypothetical protein